MKIKVKIKRRSGRKIGTQMRDSTGKLYTKMSFYGENGRVRGWVPGGFL